MAFGSIIDQMAVALGLDKRGFDQGMRDAAARVGQFDRDMGRASGGVKQFGTAMSGLRNIGAGIGVGLGIGSVGILFNKASRSAQDFETEMAKVSTLLADTSGIDALAESVDKLSKSFGIGAVEQASGLYEIIAAGIEDTAKATEILTVANKLAVGGVTSVAIAADGLTSILSGYGDAISSAAHAADILFVSAADGKTDIAELAAGIGQVAPLAAALGVSFEETAAAIAALTKGGISSAEAFTGLRAILSSVLGATTEAKTEAKRLGLDFTAAGIQAKGFAGFMEDVVRATGGSAESLALLFGNVRAVLPALNLAGQAGADFEATLSRMANAAGVTDAAVAKMLGTTEKATDILRANFASAFRGLGEELNKALLPVAKSLARNFDDITLAVKSLTKALALLAAGFVALRAAMIGAAVAGQVAAFVSLASTVRNAAGAMALFQAVTVGISLPITAVVVGITAIAGAFYLTGQRAREAAEAAEQAVTDFKNALDAMEVRGLKAELKLVTREWESIGAKIELANRELDAAKKASATAPSVGSFFAIEAAEKKVTDAVNEQTKAREKMLQVIDELAERVPTLTIEAPEIEKGSTTGVDNFAKSFKRLSEQVDATFIRLDFFQAKLARIAGSQAPGTIGGGVGFAGEIVGGQVFAEIERLEVAFAEVGRQIDLNKGDLLKTAELMDLQLRIAERLAAIKFKPDTTPIPLVKDENLLGFNGKAIKEAADSTAELATQFQVATMAGRGLLQIADGMGKLDDATRRVLDGVLGLVDAFGAFKESARQAAEAARLVEQAASLARAGKATESAAASSGAAAASAASMVAKVAGIIAAIGAFVSVVSSIFAKTQAQQERENILKKNNESLDKLRLAMEGFIITAKSTLDASRALGQVLSTAIGRQLAQLAQAPQKFISGTSLADFDAMLKESGTSLRELQAFAEANGIEILDSKGRLVAGAMDQLVEALKLAAQEAASFSNSVADQSTLLSARVDIFELDSSPLAEAQRAFDFMADNLSPAVAHMFQGFDLATEEGRAAAEAALRKMFEFIEGGQFGFDPSLLGNFETIEEFLEHILGADNALDAFAEAAQKSADAMTGVPEGFRLAAARFNATAEETGSSLENMLSGLVQPGKEVDIPGAIAALLGGGGPGPSSAIDSALISAISGQAKPSQDTYQITIDARDKTVQQLFIEIEAEARRKKAATTGNGSFPFHVA